MIADSDTAGHLEANVESFEKKNKRNKIDFQNNSTKFQMKKLKLKNFEN